MPTFTTSLGFPVATYSLAKAGEAYSVVRQLRLARIRLSADGERTTLASLPREVFSIIEGHVIRNVWTALEDTLPYGTTCPNRQGPPRCRRHQLEWEEFWLNTNIGFVLPPHNMASCTLPKALCLWSNGEIPAVHNRSLATSTRPSRKTSDPGFLYCRTTD